MRVGVVGLAARPEPFLTQLFAGLAAEGIEVRRGRRGADVLYLPWTATAVEHADVFDHGRPVVVSCRGAQVNVAPWNPQRQHLHTGLPRAFARAAAVHCVSDAMVREAEQHGLDRAKAVVIRPAVDLDRFRPSGLPPGRPLRLVSVGRLQWRKGYEDAVVALRQLLDGGTDARYTILGEEADGGATRFTVHDLGLTASVDLLQPAPHNEVVGHLEAAHVLVLPSLSEGIANAALEAMACARPVVVTDCGGMTEAVSDGVEGRVIPVRDPAALAAAVAELDGDRDRAAAMGRAGRARVERAHDLRTHVHAFADLFRSVL